jgi:predicted signal transduction protein with EAL and GGDEF domain
VCQEDRERVAIDGEKLARTVSIGVALGVPGRDTTSDLLRRADAAALTTKNAGSNKVAVFSDDMSLKSEFRAAPCAWRSPKAWSYRTSRPHG